MHRFSTSRSLCRIHSIKLSIVRASGDVIVAMENNVCSPDKRRHVVELMTFDAFRRIQVAHKQTFLMSQRYVYIFNLTVTTL